MADMFRNLPTSVPKNDPKIERVDLTQADMGARASHLPKLVKNSKQQIKHVSG
jgi:hypothetical protein